MTQRAFSTAQEDSIIRGNPLIMGDVAASLGIFLCESYKRTLSIEDLEEGIRFAEKAVEFSDTNATRAGRLNNLAILMGKQALRTSTIIDYDAAIQMAQKALDMATDEYPERWSLLSTLGTILCDKYTKSGHENDLEESIRVSRESLGIIPDDHPERAAELKNLGLVLDLRAVERVSISDADEAMDCFLAILSIPNLPLISYIEAYTVISHLGVDWQEGYELMSSATKLISRLLPRSFEITDKQEVIKQVVGLASDAAAFALGAEKGPQVALELLEQGRDLLSSSFEELRIDILHLQEKHPNLAKEFLRLRDQLQAPVTFEILPGLKQEHRAMAVRLNLQITASKEFDELTEEIRKLPGFEEFLAAPCPAQIKNAAQCDPIVVVNISDHRCDALLIQPHEIRALNLPTVSKVEIEQKARARKLGSPEILEWLWDTIASPILDALGFTQEPSSHGDWPHVWWIPTGPLRSFPLHAAGYHAKQSSETVLDRVISSYSTSVKSIIYGRHRRLFTLDSGKALLVAMAQTPGISPLPNATKEVAVVRSLCKSLGLEVAEPKPLRENVMECLRNCKIFHFAGHGYTDIINPLLSALYLEDWNDEILSVSDLLDQSLHESSPFLAYLSACGTGQVKNEKSVDESIHLISACQLSGFRHVIGTLWDVSDKHCVEMAATTYKEIVDKGLSDESVSRGLHQAIRKLRNSWLDGKSRDRYEGTDQRTVGKRRGNGNCVLNARRKRRVRNYTQRCRLDKKAARGKIRTREVFIPRKLVEESALSREQSHRPIRDVLCDAEDEERGPLHWVPYVHYGV
ncbi:hypothetical protein HD806DRAFT_490775 [Xylariaceae sp. AK1471]|nr:hypothetical protein HD806DRAFT_490775 [Xylariaceae sp. AK1471]